MVSRFLVGVQNDPGDFSCVGSAACPVGLKAFRSPEGAEEYHILYIIYFIYFIYYILHIIYYILYIIYHILCMIYHILYTVYYI